MAESIHGSTIPITDGTGAQWTIVAGKVIRNGTATSATQAALLLYWNHLVYYQSNTAKWFNWANNAWMATTDPRVPTSPTESAEGTSVVADASGNGGTIYDAKLAAWTLVAGAVQVNGSSAGFSQGVVQLYYHNHAVHQQNNAGSWWYWDGITWVGTTSPAPIAPTGPTAPTLPTGPTGPTESAQGATVTSTIGAIVDASLVKWTLVSSATSGLQVARDATVDVTTANVISLLYWNHSVYQQNNAGGWWYWNGTWVATTDPRMAPTGPTGPVAANTVAIDVSKASGAVLHSELFGSSMAADVDFTPWQDATLQNTAKVAAGFGLPGMYARINGENNIFTSGGINTAYIDRICTALPKIIDLVTGTWSVTLGGPGASPTTPSTFGTYAVQAYNRFKNNGVPCKNFEIWNECDGIDIATYSNCFNAAATALHGIDPTIQLIGTNDSWMNGGRMKELANRCGSNIARYHYHSYSVDSSYSDVSALQQAITRFSGDAAGLRSSVRGTAGANIPAGVGEYNMSGAPPGDARQQQVQGAVFNVLGLYSAFMADPMTTHGALWDWYGDGYYGQIATDKVTLYPVAYAMKNCRQYMSGRVVSSSVGSGMNLKCIATTNAARTSVLLINYDTSHDYPIRITGLSAPTVTYTEVSNGHRQGFTQTLSQAALSNITIPALSVVTISS